MLKKTERLSKKEFSEYFKQGKRFQFPELTIIYTPASTLHASVVVSKKVAKQAVKRNLLRRRVYATLRQTMKSAEQTGVFIVVVKPGLTAFSRKSAGEVVRKNIASVLEKT